MRSLITAMAMALAIFVAACEDDSAPVQVAKVDTLASVVSPCEDVDAERIALALSKRLLAPKWLYDRVHHDLSTIRETFADSVPAVNIKHASSPGYFDAFLDLNMINPDDSLTTHALDSVCQIYDLSWRELFYTNGWLVLSSPRRYYTPELMKAFTTLPGILILQNVEVFFDGPDLYVFRDNQNFKYFFMGAGGDCQEGCAWRQYAYFVSENGKCRHAGTSDTNFVGDPWNTPVWNDTLQLAKCAKTPQAYWLADSGWTIYEQCGEGWSNASPTWKQQQ